MPADSKSTIAALDALMIRISAAGAVGVKRAALAVQAEGMRQTRVLSGTLRRSWRTESGPNSLGTYAAWTGPTMVYARRLELGFKGADSLGRVYNQAPKPYVRPAYETMLSRIPAIVVSSLRQAFKL